MNPNLRLFGLVGRGGCDRPLSLTRAGPIRMLTTVLVRRGGHVRRVWWYGAYSVTRHDSRGSLSAVACLEFAGALPSPPSTIACMHTRVVCIDHDHHA